MLAVSSVALCSCGGSHSSGYLNDRLEDFVDRTVPAQATGITKANVHEDRSGQHASWEFESEESATEYAQWLKSRMTGFTVLQSSSTKLIFSKSTDGDATSLVAEIKTKAHGIHVTVDVDASPD